MNLHLGTGEWIIIGVCAALGAWFLAGMAINRRRGASFFLRFSEGLTGCAFSALRWLDLSTAIVGFTSSASAPMEKTEAILALERRENFFLWIFQHAAGRRDSVMLRSALRKKPCFELHLLPASEPAAHSDDVSLREEFGGFRLYASAASADKAASVVKALAQRFAGALLQVSLRRTVPHLLLHMKADAVPRDGSLVGMIQEISSAL